MKKKMFAYLSFILFLSCTTISIPNSKMALKEVKKGSVSISKGEYELARTHFNLALEYDARNELAFNGLGVIALKAHRYKLAKILFHQAILLDNDFIEARGNLGVVEMKFGNYDKAVSYLKSAIYLNPGFVVARYNIALCYMTLSKFKESEEEFLKVSALLHDNKEIQLYLALIYALQKKTVQSIKILNKYSFDNYSEKSFGLLIRGINEMNLKRIDNAIELFNKALLFEPGKVEILHQKAVAFAYKGKLIESRKILSRILQSPRSINNYPGTAVLMLEILRKTGDVKKYNTILKKLKKIHPNYKIPNTVLFQK